MATMLYTVFDVFIAVLCFSVGIINCVAICYYAYIKTGARRYYGGDHLLDTDMDSRIFYLSLRKSFVAPSSVVYIISRFLSLLFLSYTTWRVIRNLTLIETSEGLAVLVMIMAALVLDSLSTIVLLGAEKIVLAFIIRLVLGLGVAATSITLLVILQKRLGSPLIGPLLGICVYAAIELCTSFSYIALIARNCRVACGDNYDPSEDADEVEQMMAPASSANRRRQARSYMPTTASSRRGYESDRTSEVELGTYDASPTTSLARHTSSSLSSKHFPSVVRH